MYLKRQYDMGLRTRELLRAKEPLEKYYTLFRLFQ